MRRPGLVGLMAGGSKALSRAALAALQLLRDVRFAAHCGL
jgi:hypothetical protein